jgi:hypothetical protein
MKWVLTVWCFAVYQKCDKSEYTSINYEFISLLRAAYKLLPIIVLYNVTKNVETITGNSQFGFWYVDRDGSCIVYWWGCGGELQGWRVGQTARNTAIRLGRLFYLNSQSVWNPYATILIGRIMIKCNM